MIAATIHATKMVVAIYPGPLRSVLQCVEWLRTRP